MELIKISEKGLVSAKELYLGLGLNKTQWARWYKTNIVNNEFFHVGHDFVGVRHDVEGNETEDFAISLEFAKHIAMMARTKKSHEYRNYFLVCEEKLKEIGQASYMIQDPIERAKTWIKEQEETQTLLLTTKKQEQIINELKPKADYTDLILKNKGLVTITQIAKDYGMSGQELNKKLHELKVQYKQSKQWLLYSSLQDKGYTHSETIDITRTGGIPDISMITKWTQKGRLFLYDLLKENYILPIIER